MTHFPLDANSLKVWLVWFEDVTEIEQKFLGINTPRQKTIDWINMHSMNEPHLHISWNCFDCPDTQRVVQQCRCSKHKKTPAPISFCPHCSVLCHHPHLCPWSRLYRLYDLICIAQDKCCSSKAGGTGEDYWADLLWIWYQSEGKSQPEVRQKWWSARIIW